MRRQWIGVLLIVAALLLGAFLLVRSAPSRIEVGTRAPEFTATNLATGTLVSFDSAYRGTVTLVNVWATWCEPCKEEIPAMDSLYRTLGPKGFRIAAVSIDKGTPESVREFARKYGISFDVLLDPAGDIQQVYQTTGVPESFLVNRSGHIVRIIQRAHPWNSPGSQRIVEELLASPGE